MLLVVVFRRAINLYSYTIVNQCKQPDWSVEGTIIQRSCCPWDVSGIMCSSFIQLHHVYEPAVVKGNSHRENKQEISNVPKAKCHVIRDLPESVDLACLLHLLRETA